MEFGAHQGLTTTVIPRDLGSWIANSTIVVIVQEDHGEIREFEMEVEVGSHLDW